MIQTRFNLLSSRYVEKRELDTFRTTVSKTYLPTDTFKTYKKSQETLKSIEEKLRRPFSLLTIHRHSQKGDQNTKNYFNLDTIVSILKKISLRWLISLLVPSGIAAFAFYLLSSIST